MKIVQVASEFSPFMRVGNLADAVSGLTRALADRGHQLSVFLPAHRHVVEHAELPPREKLFECTIEMGTKFELAEIFRVELEGGINLYLVSREEYFDRSNAYSTLRRDYDDNARRYIFFGKAVVESLIRLNVTADVVQCHDWTAALVPVFLRYAEAQRGMYLASRTLATIHDVQYQGIFSSSSFRLTNLPREEFKPETLEFYNQINFQKGGIAFADYITTVSPNYANELLVPGHESGLEGALNKRKDHYCGISLGIDTERWDPATDPHIAAHYDAIDLAGKEACRVALLKKLEISPDFSGPVYIAWEPFRTDPHGIYLQAVRDFIGFQKVLFVVAGHPDDEMEEAWEAFRADEPNKVRLLRNPDHAEFSQLIAGADYFFDLETDVPCSLNLMHAQRYGCIPIAFSAGGQLDAIETYCPEEHRGDGILMDLSSVAVAENLQLSLRLYREQRINPLRSRAMSRDHSWKLPAEAYEKLFQEIFN